MFPRFDIDAFGGALLFAGMSARLFTSVEIRSTDTFGIAQLRVGGVVPEPGTVALLMGAGIAALGLRRKSSVRQAV